MSDNDDDRDTTEVTLYDDEALELMQGWTGGTSDPLYAISSTGGQNYAWVFEYAIDNLDADINRVLQIGPDEFQLGKGVFTKAEIDELHSIRDALSMALYEDTGKMLERRSEAIRYEKPKHAPPGRHVTPRSRRGRQAQRRSPKRKFRIGQDVEMISNPTNVGHVVGFDPDGSVMVQWHGGRTVTGVSPDNLKGLPPGHAGRRIEEASVVAARTGEIIPSKRWENKTTGATASIYGAAPWTGARGDRQEDWEMKTVGWTVRWSDGTIGIGRQPFQSRREAQDWLDKYNARMRRR